MRKDCVAHHSSPTPLNVSGFHTERMPLSNHRCCVAAGGGEGAGQLDTAPIPFFFFFPTLSPAMMTGGSVLTPHRFQMGPTFCHPEVCGHARRTRGGGMVPTHIAKVFEPSPPLTPPCTTLPALSRSAWHGASFFPSYLLGLLAKIKCSICSYQLNF